MDLAKIDSGLCAYLAAASESSRSISVFVSTKDTLVSDQCDLLKSLGVRNVAPGKRLFTARLTATSIQILSEKPWVVQLSLAQTLKPLSGVTE
jgi:hypothetical protein